MTETMVLTFKQDEGRDIKELWRFIDSGFSVVKATYSAKLRRFKMTFSNGLWPAITIPCSGCGVRMPPAYLSFKPFPQDEHLCIVCNRPQVATAPKLYR